MDVKIFSLENQKRKIYDKRTKKYFEEVYKSYANGCYRSSTVMLWSVVVCDLIFKLQELKDMYSDITADKILKEIENIQNDDPYSPKWEKELLKMVFERTQLLDTTSNHKLMMIQDHRHLSAHPILSNVDTLFEPTEEMVRSDIRNAIEVVLCKPPFLTQKILGTILSDLAKVKDIIVTDIALKKYLESKYLKSINKEILLKLFRGFWKFAFVSEEDVAKDNRDINLKALSLIYAKSEYEIQETIKTEIPYYSNISSDDEIIQHLVEFLSVKYEIYDSLNDAAKEIINPFLDKNLSYYGIAFFLSEDPKRHMDDLIRRIDSKFYKKYGNKDCFINREHLDKIKSVCDEFGLSEEYRRFGIACFINSADFERADLYYDRYIEKNLENYTESEFKTLLFGANKNNQCYWRNRSRNGNDGVLMLQAAKKKLPDGYDFSQYDCLPVEKMSEEIHEEIGEV